MSTGTRGPATDPGTGTSPRTLAALMRTSAGAALVGLATNLLAVPLVLATAGELLFGVWITMVTFMAVGGLADAGVRTEVARRVADANARRDRSAVVRAAHEGTTAVTVVALPALSLFIAGTGTVVSSVLPDGVPGYSRLEVVIFLWILLATLGVQLVSGAHLATLRGLQRQDLELRAQVLSIVAGTAVLACGLWAGGALWALLAAQVTTVALSTGVQAVVLRRLVPELRLQWLRPGRTTLSYLGLSSMALLTQVSDVVDTQSDKLVLAHFIGPTSVAAFHIGATLALQGKLLAVMPLSPLMVGVAEAAAHSPATARELQVRLSRATAVLTACVLGGIHLFAPVFVAIWIGPGNNDIAEVSRWFAVAVLINVMFAPAAMQAYGEGRHWLSAASATVTIALNVAASVVLTSQIGLMGAVYGSMLGNVGGALVFVFIARRRLSYWVSPPVRALVLAGVLVLAGRAVHVEAWSLPGQITAAVGYAVVVLAAGSWLERVNLWRMLRSGAPTTSAPKDRT